MTTDAGLRNVFAEVIYEDLPAAITWLADAFGFAPGRQATDDEGTVVFAELHAGAGTLLARVPERDGELSPRSLGGTSQQLYVLVDDPDAHYAQATARGAEIVLEPTDMPFGARLYSVRDPEGHLWTFGTYQVRAGS
ncbi:VOC family protein [Pseudonocardia acaciae]|uniref:VOC family protein n=1 Tax=Pseudonocardia acaciae TaxID=551276 RepID=UPI00048C9AE7|nr:VOC family protein [Pseudonocardia acaciae]